MKPWMVKRLCNIEHNGASVWSQPLRSWLHTEGWKIIYKFEFSPPKPVRKKGGLHIDVKNLRKTDIINGIDGEKWISIKRQKTNVPSRIPLLLTASTLLNQYQNNPICLNNGMIFPLCPFYRDIIFFTHIIIPQSFNGDIITSMGKILADHSGISNLMIIF